MRLVHPPTASPSMQITQNSALPGGVHSTRPCHRLYKRHSSILHPPRTQAKVQNFFGKLFQKDDGDVTKKENQPQAPLPLRLFPPFQVINKNSDYSLRLYELFPVVTMEYENRAEGYGSLGNYIDGRNSDNRRFPQTQPVVMQYFPDGRKTMSMYLGGLEQGSLELASLPKPNDRSAKVDVAGGELVAVAKFEGYITPAAAESVRQKLLRALERDGVKLSQEAVEGGFRVAQYGAVYQLEQRYNELYIKVAV